MNQQMNQPPMGQGQPAVSKWLWITLIIVVILGGVFAAWYFLVGPGKTTTTTATTTPATTDETADWTSFLIPDLSLSFKYPPAWGTASIKNSKGTIGTTNSILFNKRTIDNTITMGYATSDLSVERGGAIFEGAAVHPEIYTNCKNFLASSDYQATSSDKCEDISSGSKIIGIIITENNPQGDMLAGPLTKAFYMTGNAKYPIIGINIADTSNATVSDFTNLIKSFKFTTATAATSTADWKTYTSNPGFTKYTFKNPTTYTAVDPSTELDGGAQLTKSGIPVFRFGFITGTKEAAVKSYSDITSKFMQSITSTTTVKVGTIDATEITGKFGSSFGALYEGKNGSLVIVSNNDVTYLIQSLDSGDTTIQDNFSTILSTFQFTQ